MQYFSWTHEYILLCVQAVQINLWCSPSWFCPIGITLKEKRRDQNSVTMTFHRHFFVLFAVRRFNEMALGFKALRLWLVSISLRCLFLTMQLLFVTLCLLSSAFYPDASVVRLLSINLVLFSNSMSILLSTCWLLETEFSVLRLTMYA